MILRYFQALLKSWWSITFLVLGAISTAMTFIPLYRANFILPRNILLVVAIGAVLIAPFQVYASLQKRVDELENDRTRNSKKAHLVILKEEGSQYIRHVNRSQPGQEYGFVVELRLSIENKGNRNSTIRNHELRVAEIGQHTTQVFSKQMVEGPNATYGIGGNTKNLADGLTSIPAESVEGPVSYRVYVASKLPLDLRIIHARLSLRDTEGVEATEEFTVGEHR